MTIKKYSKKHGLKKFILLLLIVSFYTAIVIFQYGVKDGLTVTLLTWTFFVLCTPIADAGFLIDFPVRVIIGLKMIYSELIVWTLAILIVTTNLIFNKNIFDTTYLLKLFHEILITPWPLWMIIIISAIGTYLSIYIGDQIFNMVIQHKHHKKIKSLQIKRLILELVIFAVILLTYYTLLKVTHTSISS